MGSQPPQDASKPPRTRSCLFQGCGCLAVLALLLLAQLPLFLKASRARDSVKVGMTPAETLESAAGYTWCTARPLGEGATPDMELRVTSLSLNEGTAVRAFASRAELGAFLEQHMRSSGRAWALTFGYIRQVPPRQYFGVEFGPDARVRKVSAVWNGSLD